MSHFTKLETKLNNQEALVAALMDMGFTKDQIEVHSGEGEFLKGYEANYGGKYQKQKAHVIIRQKYLGASYNDIGFTRREDGTFEAFVSDMHMANSLAKKNKVTEGLTGFNEGWLETLGQRHSVNVIKIKAAELGYSMEEHYEGDKVVVTVDKAY